MSRSDLRKMTTMSTTPLSSEAVPATGAVFEDLESYSNKLTKNISTSSGNSETRGLILKSEKIRLDNVKEGIKNRIIAGLSLRPEKQSDEFITILEHKCLIVGESYHIDPDFVVPELCTTVYERYLPDEESNLLKSNRVCEVIMIGDGYGIIKGSPLGGIDFVEAKVPDKGDKKEDTVEKFKEKKTTKLGDTVVPKAKDITDTDSKIPTPKPVDPNTIDPKEHLSYIDVKDYPVKIPITMDDVVWVSRAIQGETWGKADVKETMLMTWALIQRVGLFKGTFKNGKFKSFNRMVQFKSQAISPAWLEDGLCNTSAPGAKGRRARRNAKKGGVCDPNGWLKWRHAYRSIVPPPDGKWNKNRDVHKFLNPKIYETVLSILTVTPGFERPSELHPKVVGWHMTRYDLPRYIRNTGIRPSVSYRLNTYYREPPGPFTSPKGDKYWARESMVTPVELIKNESQ